MVAMLSLDFETGSRADLRRIGAYAYAKHPSTFVLCLGWAFDNEPVQVWRPGQPFPQRIIDHLRRVGIVRGWNVIFEWLIWNEVLVQQLVREGVVLPPLKLMQIQDTMAIAAYYGLPLKLEHAADALNTKARKDVAGHRLMLQMTKPRTVDMWTGATTWWHQTDAGKYAMLCVYCAQDVVAEREIATALPVLTADEQAMWWMDQAINERGVPLDIDLVIRLKELAQQCAARANRDLTIATHGAVTRVTASAAMLVWLKANTPYPNDNLRKDVVAARLDDPSCVGRERDVLELRAQNAKTSAAKLDKMLHTVEAPRGIQRVRGMLQYYGAMRTGRWAGRLIQLQNLPRGVVKDIDRALDLVKAGHDLETIEMFFGNAMDVVSSGLRGCIAVPDDKLLYVADFSQIEARVLAWLAGQMDMLRVFTHGDDPYLYQARLQGSTNRQFGKVLVLALGYGMGWSRFMATALLYGVVLTEQQAQRAVTRWRDHNEVVVEYWNLVNDAVVRLVQRYVGRPGALAEVKIGGVTFSIWESRHLIVTLPSGRKLCYRDIRYGPDPVTGKPTLTYMGVNQFTRQWTALRTWGAKIVENITQAVARDVMAEAARAAERQGLELVLMVHDELIGVADRGLAQMQLDRLMAMMRQSPWWAKSLPVDCAGWIGRRYRK